MQSLPRFLLLGSLSGSLILCAGMARADVKAGVDAWAAGDFSRAVREWQPLADRGDPDAEFNLAQAYKMGRGVPMDLDKAETLYGAAARQGHAQAADIYGLLLFQRGDRANAMPYIKGAADHGDPRAQYILGVAHFNGDTVEKDWVRAYALVSLAQQAGLPQAANALKQMDQHIPLEDRQKAVLLSVQLANAAEAARAREATAVSLGTAPIGPARPAGAGAGAAFPATPFPASSFPATAAADGDGPDSAGADFARPAVHSGLPPRTVAATPPAALSAPAAKPASKPAAKPAPALVAAKPAAVSPAPAPARPREAAPAAPAGAAGPWRVQLGAFGVAGNAQALWSKISARAELAGHPRLLVPAGKLTKLQAGGFASQADAAAACARLTAAGFTCVPTRD